MFFEYFISFALAFIVSFVATPIAKKVAFYIGAVDVPKDERRMHKKPIARLGGLAIFSGFIMTLMFGLISTFIGVIGITPNQQLLGMLVGVFIIVGMGIVDDIKQLGPKIKFVFQILAAIAVVWISGDKISIITNPFSSTGTSVISDFIAYPLTIFWIVGITNAINFIDGLDGLAAGVSSISYLSLMFIAILYGEVQTAMIIAILAGATLGFLPYNFNPAKIFMGDTGSTFLGFTLGVISIQGMMKTYAAISIVIPILVLGLPLFDTTFAILRRLIQRKPIMAADRGHLHHRLIDMGFSQRQSVVTMYAVSGALGLVAIVLADKGALSAVVLIIALSIFVIAGSRYMSEINDAPDIENKVEEENIPSLSIQKAKK
ncbi:MraY family glycosyltransferase [Acetivibrio cellulolyticus]|uniref:MraY family glycosyltransferase n=1 Tax=Acetivibrio cellulolyticus TaxID=35830 RepID=UPI0002481B7A|nr:MraY family glycosyltransferase [Acetivibrio cellulolyticus]